MSDVLAERWQRLCAQLGVAPDPGRAVLDELLAAYAQPGRCYHNQAHLADVLATIERLSDQTQDRAAVELAAWFHDAVYDAQAKDNEERSAELAAARLAGLGIAAARLARVRDLILLTSKHQPAANDVDGHVLCDADLAILGSKDYADYAAAIRQEYAWVPEADYRAGRAAVLQSFLMREYIYHTNLMRREREGLARANLQRELERLR